MVIRVNALVNLWPVFSTIFATMSVKKMHAVERIRQLFALSLNYPIPQSQGDYGIAQHFLSLPAFDERPYLVFLHATTRDEKHWPESHWRELIALLADSGIRIKLPWGAEHEHQRAIRLAADFDYVDVLPKMSLAQVAQVIAGAKSVVSVDTGLSHLTAALDKPNITLFGPTDPGLIGGYGKAQMSVKAKGGDIAEIKPQQIFDLLDI
ncbi:lipopolysaccharide heptosyltransferase I [Proteus penneri ATCC 35198]|nr:lipopolysaccharide heptosyltransferase I [Proteus penneri ATCC 35198]